ncbi:MAG: GntR family transcriptional regulator [Acidimicrobiia bacterium]
MTADDANETMTLGSRRSLASEIASALRERILRGDLPSGERVGELEIAASYGTSQAPVREALAILRTEGLLVTVPRRGTFVSEVSIEDAAAAYEIRRRLDPFVVDHALNRLTAEDLQELNRLADAMGDAAERGDFDSMTRFDLELHGMLWHRCESPIFGRTWEMLSAGIRKFIGVAGEATFGDELTEVAAMHRQLVDLIHTGDKASVIAELRRQLDIFWARLDEPPGHE